ncbi:hypothetical protein [Microcoleus vaginatus]|uniref:hypothetical protein n=1 Tax=Microcoleus vaginatus TaxID=119532 RepID=UPI001F6243C2
MPVPQEINFLVEQASCLFIKGYGEWCNISNVTEVGKKAKDLTDLTEVGKRFEGR